MKKLPRIKYAHIFGESEPTNVCIFQIKTDVILTQSTRLVEKV